jgi:hypothetical protein
MKYIVSLFVLSFLLFLDQPVLANDQSVDSLATPLLERPFYIKLKGGGSIDFHFRDKDEENPNIPSQFQSLSERPSIAYFFDDGSGLMLDLTGSILINSNDILRLLLGVTYERSKSSNAYQQNSEIILGNELVITAFCPYVGIEGQLQGSSCMAYGYIGPCFKTYEGNYSNGGVDWKSIYVPTVALRIAGGLEIQNIFTRRLFINISVLADFGSVERDKVEAYHSGQLLGIGTPTGEKSLKDFTIHAQLSIGYIFDMFQ